MSLLRICIKPPQRGHFHVAVGDEAAKGESVDVVSMRSSRRMSVRLWERSRLARKPNWRMRTKPSGSTCCT